MKTFSFTFLLAFVLCNLVYSQPVNEQPNTTRLPGYRTNFEANPFWHNWFISANLGANTLQAEWSSKAKFKNTITFMPTLAIGKWFTPWWGLRLQGGGGSLHGFTPYVKSMIHMHYIYAHADFMLGLFQFFGQYTEERRFDLVPFAGIGGMTRGKDQSFTINAGIQARYAISERFDVNVEFSGMILDDGMVEVNGFPNDGIAGLTAGITYRFKNRKFKQAPQAKTLEQAYTDNGNLKKQLAILQSKEPEVKIIEKEIIREIPAVADAYSEMSFVVPFRFNGTEVEDIYQPILWNIGKFMQAHPDLKIVITGYADKYGTTEVNQRISKARAQAVADILQKEYGIGTDRFFIKYMGKENPFYKDQNKWNRCVVIGIAY